MTIGTDIDVALLTLGEEVTKLRRANDDHRALLDKALDVIEELHERVGLLESAKPFVSPAPPPRQVPPHMPHLDPQLVAPPSPIDQSSLVCSSCGHWKA